MADVMTTPPFAPIFKEDDKRREEAAKEKKDEHQHSNMHHHQREGSSSLADMLFTPPVPTFAHPKGEEKEHKKEEKHGEEKKEHHHHSLVDVLFTPPVPPVLKEPHEPHSPTKEPVAEGSKKEEAVEPKKEESKSPRHSFHIPHPHLPHLPHLRRHSHEKEEKGKGKETAESEEARKKEEEEKQKEEKLHEWHEHHRNPEHVTLADAFSMPAPPHLRPTSPTAGEEEKAEGEKKHERKHSLHLPHLHRRKSKEDLKHEGKGKAKEENANEQAEKEKEEKLHLYHEHHGNQEHVGFADIFAPPAPPHLRPASPKAGEEAHPNAADEEKQKEEKLRQWQETHGNQENVSFANIWAPPAPPHMRAASPKAGEEAHAEQEKGHERKHSFHVPNVLHRRKSHEVEGKATEEEKEKQRELHSPVVAGPLTLEDSLPDSEEEHRHSIHLPHLHQSHEKVEKKATEDQPHTPVVAGPLTLEDTLPDPEEEHHRHSFHLPKRLSFSGSRPQSTSAERRDSQSPHRDVAKPSNENEPAPEEKERRKSSIKLPHIDIGLLTTKFLSPNTYMSSAPTHERVEEPVENKEEENVVVANEKGKGKGQEVAAEEDGGPVCREGEIETWKKGMKVESDRTEGMAMLGGL